MNVKGYLCQLTSSIRRNDEEETAVLAGKVNTKILGAIRSKNGTSLKLEWDSFVRSRSEESVHLVLSVLSKDSQTFLEKYTDKK